VYILRQEHFVYILRQGTLCVYIGIFIQICGNIFATLGLRSVSPSPSPLMLLATQFHNPRALPPARLCLLHPV